MEDEEAHCQHAHFTPIIEKKNSSQLFSSLLLSYSIVRVHAPPISVVRQYDSLRSRKKKKSLFINRVTLSVC